MFLAASFFESFFSAASCKKGFKNGAARNFFGTSQFVMALVVKDTKLIAGNEELLVPRRNSEVSQYIEDKTVFRITFLKTSILLFQNFSEKRFFAKN